MINPDKLSPRGRQGTCVFPCEYSLYKPPTLHTLDADHEPCACVYDLHGVKGLGLSYPVPGWFCADVGLCVGVPPSQPDSFFAQAPSFTTNPHNQDVYSAYNKPEAVIDWLAKNEVSTVLTWLNKPVSIHSLEA